MASEERSGGARIALVTGATRGIGLATARGLAELGFVVLVGARDASKGEEVVRSMVEEGLDAHLLELDITDERQVRRAAETIDRRYAHLDVLVNNAAVKLEFHPSPPSAAPLSLVRETFETNVFATMVVIQAMLPLLRRADAARVVNLSSGLGSLGLATTPGSRYRDRPLLSYNVAKAAVNSLTVQFANELRDTPIKFNAVDPGYTNTGMTRNTGSRTAEQAAAVVVRLATIPPDGPNGGFFDEDGEVPW